MKWIFLSIAIIAEVIGTTALKSAENFTRVIPSAIVVVGYSVAFFFLSLTLKTIPVGIAYAVWSGAGIILISVTGYIFFKQALDLPAIVGILLIVAGVIAVSVFSKSVSH